MDSFRPGLLPEINEKSRFIGLPPETRQHQNLICLKLIKLKLLCFRIYQKLCKSADNCEKQSACIPGPRGNLPDLGNYLSGPQDRRTAFSAISVWPDPSGIRRCTAYGSAPAVA